MLVKGATGDCDGSFDYLVLPFLKEERILRKKNSPKNYGDDKTGTYINQHA